jgi:DNA-binding NarL/FixJ family response regulator
MQEQYLIDVVNAAYNLSETDRAAMRHVAQAAANLVPVGPVIVAAYDGEQPLDSTQVWFERADERDIARFFEWQRTASQGIRQLALSLEPCAVQLGGEPLREQQLHSLTHQSFPLHILANTGGGRGLHITFGAPAPSEWRPSRLTAFHELGLHLAAAWRLRTALNQARHAARPCWSEPAAGASVATWSQTACDTLRHAVEAHGGARDAQRSTGDQLWSALVSGQWSLLDSFSAEGTRYLVALRNPTGGEALRALSRREQTALEFALAGRSGKWIAFEMKLSESAVTRTLRSALRKISVDDTLALSGVRSARFEPLEGLAAEDRLAIARLNPPAFPRASLSDAERAIVGGLLGGKRVAAIARERGTSPRTVTNQLTSTYQKLRVSSRRELLALFA